jgi:3-phenylpropionate/cinnamic acid dioxygenase small subunit
MSADREEIVAVQLRYARAIDTKDWPLLRTCFTDDITGDYGDIGSWTAAVDLVTFMEHAHAGMGPTQHLLSNFQVDVAGDRASSTTYVHSVTVLASHADDWIDTVGTYEDHLRRGADGWRIADRVFRTTRMLLSPSLTPRPRRTDDRGATS